MKVRRRLLGFFITVHRLLGEEVSTGSIPNEHTLEAGSWGVSVVGKRYGGHVSQWGQMRNC
jgi:hypothetical protein